jgi:hypothetical protein
VRTEVKDVLTRAGLCRVARAFQSLAIGFLSHRIIAILSGSPPCSFLHSFVTPFCYEMPYLTVIDVCHVSFGLTPAVATKA